MKAVILAAGYATRLYPLTKNKPKPLLPIAGEPIIDHILKRLKATGSVKEMVSSRPPSPAIMYLPFALS